MCYLFRPLLLPSIKLSTLLALGLRLWLALGLLLWLALGRRLFMALGHLRPLDLVSHLELRLPPTPHLIATPTYCNGVLLTTP